ncbi:aminoacyl-tRNA hydrolase [Candidatus Roizmanbacteria bacterium]|nr:aminoacyl-tRNA hydrolase [Candidatus Roizmanbacteria bacterium]
MKLIIGLGNPDTKYQNNRHNVGHMFVDFMIKELTGSRVNGLLLAKTATYMNLSGKSVQALMQKHHAKLEDLIIVHDDLDIPLSKFRIVKGYGPKLHNGIDSIEEKLGTKDFLRVRIGVDNRTPENRIPGIEYVLRDFEEREGKMVLDIFPQIVELMKAEKYILL